MVFHLAIKKNNFVSFAGKWMNSKSLGQPELESHMCNLDLNL